MRGPVKSIVMLLTLGLAGAAGCGGDEAPEPPTTGEEMPKVGDPGPVHVHGLGVNPRDGALFVATHTGLFRAPPGERKSERVADRYQDTMGFTVVGPDRFLGSGHPDGRDGLPPFLGLLESRDAGKTWKPLSLQGDVDFHVLEASGRRIYGFGSNFDTREVTMLVSSDGGRGWEERSPPEVLIDLAIDPSDPDRAVAAGERALYMTNDTGRTWKPVGGDSGLLAWPADDALYVAAADGGVRRSRDGGGSFEDVGEVRGQPAAVQGETGDELYVALHDGVIKQSTDGGVRWTVRSRP
jgi:hypothetical protein